MDAFLSSLCAFSSVWRLGSPSIGVIGDDILDGVDGERCRHYDVRVMGMISALISLYSLLGMKPAGRLLLISSVKRLEMSPQTVMMLGLNYLRFGSDELINL
jgi:hypothetical protein